MNSNAVDNPISVKGSNWTPWSMLAWILLTQIIIAFVGRGIGPLGPFIEHDFSLSKREVGFMPAALFLGQALSSLPTGWYVDKLGTKKMLLILSLIVGTLFLSASFSPWFFLVLTCLFFAGIGYGMMQPTSNKGVLFWFPGTFRGTAMGIKQMGVTIGSSLSALVLIPFAQRMNWQIALACSSLFVILIGVLSFVFYHEVSGEEVKFPINEPTFRNRFFLLLKHENLLLVSLAAMMLIGAQMAFYTYLLFYITGFLKLSLIVAGFFLALSEVCGSVGRVVWGLLSDFIFHGRKLAILFIIALITAICCLLLAFLPSGVNHWLLGLNVGLLGFSIAGFNGVWMNYAAESVPKEFIGIASGFSLAIASLGVVVIPPIFGILVDSTGTYLVPWIFISLTMLIALVLFGRAMRIQTFSS